jgi:hypothetical protein
MKKVAFLKEDGGELTFRDAIEFEGKLWLVPEWLEGPTEGTRRPTRIICLTGLPMQTAGPKYPMIDWFLSVPLHSDILGGRKVSQNPLVIERPEINLRVDSDYLDS